MMKTGLRISTCLLAGLLVLSTGRSDAAFPAFDPPVPVGGEFAVHTSTSNDQFLPNVYFNSAGEFACTWTDDTTIKVRIFHPDGTPKTPEIVANTTGYGTQNESQVAIADSGAFVVCWTDYQGADGELLGVLAQRFAPDGSKAGPEFVVTQVTAGSQWESMVGMDADGDIVFVWVDSIPGDGSNAGIFGRLFDSNGNATSAQFLVNDQTTLAQVNPSLAVRSDGSFVVAWQDRNPIDGSYDRIVCRGFDEFGQPLYAGVTVNVSTVGQQTHPSVASRPDGRFVVAWTDWGGADGDGAGAFFRFFAGDGTPLSGEIRANETTIGEQSIAEAAWDRENVVFVTWCDHSGIDGSGTGIFARAFDLEGTPLGGETRVNTFVTGDQIDADVAMDALGRITVIWEDRGGQDGDGSGIFAQRYLFQGAVAVPSLDPLGGLFLLLLLVGAGALFLRKTRA
jgi:hypothetical protein